ncbi:unnamed protein product [Paramecium pentaurelia]|uniref:Uncharacterized protein n=1 Tax=Paramecium pentaurelia TaxID=43138 RepID=A0A8S1TY74_9CILI|nr:unnamed protein product [Paramecium pentaurelia]
MNSCVGSKIIQRGELKNGKRVNRWDILYEEELIGGGFYDEEGDKNGKWIDINDFFSENSQVIITGEYKNGKKIGRWDILYRDNVYQQFKQIGGGSYDEACDGIKIGIWNEISDWFWANSQVIITGEYKNGKKIGRWDIFYRMNVYQQFKQIGGGSYDEAGNKNEKWIDISDGFLVFKQVTYNGEYKNGKKVGKWDIWFKDCKENNKIGGGSYDDEGNGMKVGEWIDINEEFDQRHQITYNGEYKNGQKIGLWKISKRENNILKLHGCINYDLNGQEIFRSGENSKLIHMGEFNDGKKVGPWKIWFKEYKTYKHIGGGSYDEQGNGTKIGKWIDLDDKFDNKIQILYVGEYENGQKVGRWNNVWYEKYEIGGGSYDEQGNGTKVGKWIDSDDKFEYKKQITYIGQYENGQKVGSWDIVWFCGQSIGGGSYDQNGYGIKVGQWIDLDDGFDQSKQVTYNGEYKNGKKVGRWNINWNYIKFNMFSGGGFYDEGGDEIKQGQWIEMIDDFKFDLQVTSDGEYKNGQKIGLWKISKRENNILKLHGCINYDLNGQEIFRSGEYQTFIHMGEFNNGKKVGPWKIWFKENEKYNQIGGGSYDQEGQEIKIGKWIVLGDHFEKSKQVTFVGEYQNGKKVGRWDIWFKQYGEDKENNQMQYGGGSYDNGGNGVKVGMWKELDDKQKEIPYIGEYKNGKKVGRWDSNLLNEVIGGGSYDEDGNNNKIGQWTEQGFTFNNHNLILYMGEYKNSQKVGRWDVFLREQNEKSLKHIGNGSFDKGGKGINIVKWYSQEDGLINKNIISINCMYKNDYLEEVWMKLEVEHQNNY